MTGKFRSRPDFGVRPPPGAATALRASILLAILAITLAVPARAQEAEYPVAGGRFFTQTGGDTSDPGDGYAVVDDSEARFWTAFEDFGGVAAVGYPVSRRFIWDGFVTQVMQKAVFQWRPDEQATAFVNVFDDLHRLGYDARLADELVPEQEEFNESGLPGRRSWSSAPGFWTRSPCCAGFTWRPAITCAISGCPPPGSAITPACARSACSAPYSSSG